MEITFLVVFLKRLNKWEPCFLRFKSAYFSKNIMSFFLLIKFLTILGLKFEQGLTILNLFKYIRLLLLFAR